MSSGIPCFVEDACPLLIPRHCFQVIRRQRGLLSDGRVLPARKDQDGRCSYAAKREGAYNALVSDFFQTHAACLAEQSCSSTSVVSLNAGQCCFSWTPLLCVEMMPAAYSCVTCSTSWSSRPGLTQALRLAQSLIKAKLTGYAAYVILHVEQPCLTCEASSAGCAS